MKLKLLLLLLLISQLACAYYVRHPCCNRYQPCGWWGSADYMFLWRKSRFFPPLVITHPTAVPILGTPGTRVLFGDENLGGTPKSGFRGDFGMWLTCCLGTGLSGYTLGHEKTEFELLGGPTGTPIFGQPFVNTVTSPPTPDVNLLSFPGLFTNGSIEIDSNNRIWGFDLYLRYRFFKSPCCKLDLIGGFLYNSIDDNLSVNTQTTTSPLGPTVVAVSDNFSCENQYYAGLVGFVADLRSCHWAINVIGKVGIGNMHKETEISGTTIVGFGTTLGTINSGFLAQPSNIGTHANTKFEVVPQISAILQLKIWQHIWATAGYTFIFWPAVALAGEQVDLNINPTQVSGLIGTPSPFFHENLTSFWVQGVTTGLYFCY